MAKSGSREVHSPPPPAAAQLTLVAVAKKAAPLALDPGDSVATAFGKIARGCISHLLDNQNCVLERGAGAGVHQMRVALRRLRAALALFDRLLGPEIQAELKPELRWLAGELAAARDWDVFAKETLPRCRKRIGNTKPTGVIRKEATETRTAARQRAIAAIKSPRYAALVLSLGIWVEAERWRAGMDARQIALATRSVGEHAGPLLARRARKLRNAGKRIEGLSVEQRHALRKRLKTLRYGAVCLATLFRGRRVKRTLAALGRMQDVLGAINDLAVARTLLAGLPTGSDGALAEAIAAVDGACAKQLEAKLEKLPSAWRAFRKTQAFWDWVMRLSASR
jgi:triphosphatase